MRLVLALALSLICTSALADSMQIPPPIPFPAGSVLGDTTSATNPTAGRVGEVLSSNVTTQAISSNTNTQVTSISATAGHWLCWGALYTHPASGTTTANAEVAVSTTTATLPATVPGTSFYNSSVAANGQLGFTTGPIAYNFTSTTTVYLNGEVNYAVSTLTVDGDLRCLRIW